MFGRLYLGINKITAYILHEQALNVVTPRLHVKQCWVQPITNMSVANKTLILDTHESEQRPVAEEPMKMDSVLVHAYEQEANDADGVDQVRDEYSGSMAGVKSTYAPNMARCQQREERKQSASEEYRSRDAFTVVPGGQPSRRIHHSPIEPHVEWRLLETDCFLWRLATAKGVRTTHFVC